MLRVRYAEPELSLDAFILGERIAEGGAGQVYAGQHRTTGEAVAIKLMTPGGRPEHRAAFHREAHAMASFDHPHLLPIHEYGHTVDGRPFMVMPLAEHGDLHRYAWQLDWVTAGTVLVQILEGLAHAHAHGVVHCDLKPENVLLRAAQGGVRVQLADFGIAQALRNTEDAGAIRGTPRYMAPEQLIETPLIGPATDIYALGCIAYELTARRVPFDGPTPLAISTAQVSQPPAPWTDAIGAPPALEAWIMRCLAKPPRARWPGAAEALAALRALVPAGAAVLPEPDLNAPADSTQISFAGVQAALPATRPAEPSTRLAPPAAWRRDRVTVDRMGLGVRLFGARARPLVGRDAEADVIWRRVQGAHARQSARIVIVEGAQGTGKSHLAEWMGVRADELGAARLACARYADATPDTRGLTGMLRALLRREGDLDRVRRLRGAAEIGASDGTVHTLAFGGARLTDRDPARAARVVLSWLRQWAGPRLLYLWLDDAQWDPEPWWLAEAALALDHPVVLVLTVRSDALNTRRAARLQALLNDRRVRRLPLGPLDATAHRALVAGLLPLAPDVIDELARRTHGRPLFAVHVVAGWVERDLLVESPTGLRPRDAIEVADSLDALWMARLTALFGDSPAPDLGLAALLGERFDDTVLAQAAAFAGLIIRPERFDTLCRAGLAQRTRQGWAFAHGLIRDAIARRFGNQAHHVACAKALTKSACLPADWKRVSDHWIDAGAVERGVEAALRAYQINLANYTGVDPTAGLDRIDRLLDTLQATDTHPYRLRASLLRIKARLTSAPIVDLITDITAIEESARAFGHLRAWGEALRLRAIVVRNGVGAGPAEPLFRQASEVLHRAGEPALAACAALGRAPCLSAMGRRQQAIEVIRAALETFEAERDEWWIEVARLELARLLIEVDAVDAAEEILTTVLQVTRSRGDLPNQARALLRLAECPLARGQLGLAESYFIQAGELYAIDGDLNRHHLPVWRARVALHRGALDAAATLYAEYLSAMAQVTYRDEFEWLAIIPAMVALRDGDAGRWWDLWDALRRLHAESWPASARRDLIAAARQLEPPYRDAVDALIEELKRA